MTDAGSWGAAWAMIAVIAGAGLAVAAIALVRRTVRVDCLEFACGYNALAPVVDA